MLLFAGFFDWNLHSFSFVYIPFGDRLICMQDAHVCKMHWTSVWQQKPRCDKVNDMNISSHCNGNKFKSLYYRCSKRIRSCHTLNYVPTDSVWNKIKIKYIILILNRSLISMSNKTRIRHGIHTKTNEIYCWK